MTIASHIFTSEGSGLQFDLSSVLVRPDGSFVITWINSPFGDVPYHVPDNEEFHGMYTELAEYRKAHPECFSPDPDFQEPSLDDLKSARKTNIDAETSAAILAGFDYAVDGATYHFSYALDDQQNFSDTANVCLMKQAGMPGLPDSVTWNAYTVPGGDMVRLTFDASGFLALYAGGAMRHKNGTMQRGGERKAAVEAATTAEEVEAA